MNSASPQAVLLAGIEADAASAGFTLEASQAAAARRLSELGAAVGRSGEAASRRFPARFLRRKPPRSVYLHGPVGRGKSWVMDSFYRQIPGRKRRVHFHDFFRGLHSGVHLAAASAPGADGTAIQRAVDSLLSDIDVLCFDEFHVHDVGDGMFIARLLRSAAERRLPLVVTSNYPPDQLLPNPLWHEHFIPTIEVIKEMMDIVEINGSTDFRRHPAGQDAGAAPKEGFRRGRVIIPGTPRQLGAFGLFPPPPSEQRTLKPTTQPLRVKAAGDVLWADFAELCGGLMSTADYLLLAAEYPVWVVDGVPDPSRESPAVSAAAWQRFSNAVDVLYDEDVTLFLIGRGPLDWDAAASSGRNTLPVDMARIASRLSLLGRVDGGTGNPDDGGTAGSEETRGS
ncbi:cell division protein ZapE [Arthrobacter sp. SW1]|uniref:cell division protein ZapE n=1 Tax=Arthrobacter sp. SW1 TaxID=1920889 RepID=UPI000877E61A|nr:cell division protein ZapE [Arthrobacter sp. SW1]OFI39973.1 cell division protein ZapE [Arthrobacter sp. SW1]